MPRKSQSADADAVPRLTKEDIKALLTEHEQDGEGADVRYTSRADRAVERAVVAIWKRQTADERAVRTSGHSNGVGFSGVDAEILTQYAEQLQGIGTYQGYDGRTYQRTVPKSLTPRQLAYARKRMVHYARQLADIANGVGTVEPEPEHCLHCESPVAMVLNPAGSPMLVCPMCGNITRAGMNLKPQDPEEVNVLRGEFSQALAAYTAMMLGGRGHRPDDPNREEMWQVVMRLSWELRQVVPDGKIKAATPVAEVAIA